MAAAVMADQPAFHISPTDPLGLGPAPLSAAPVAAAPVAAAPVAVAAPAPAAPSSEPTWPCASCQTRVPLAETACPNCQTPFMGGVNPDVSLRLPGVGDLASMSRGARVALMAGGTVVLAVLLVVVYLVLGHIF